MNVSFLLSDTYVLSDSYKNPKCLNNTIHKKIVTTAAAEEWTTICPANRSSPSICWAMAKEATAVGAPTVARMVPNSPWENPIQIATGRARAGTITVFTSTAEMISFQYPAADEKLKLPLLPGTTGRPPARRRISFPWLAWSHSFWVRLPNHSGMFPCFFMGLVSRLFCRIPSALMMRARVVAGSMMSSI